MASGLPIAVKLLLNTPGGPDIHLNCTYLSRFLRHPSETILKYKNNFITLNISTILSRKLKGQLYLDIERECKALSVWNNMAGS